MRAIFRRPPVRPKQRRFGDRCRNVARADVWKFAYRSGKAKFIQWGIFEQRMKEFHPISKRPNPHAGARLQLDYLKPLLQKGKFYSFPHASIAGIANTRLMVALEDAAHALDNAASGQFVTFQVLETHMQNKKLLPHCEAKQRMRSMTWPIIIQRWSVWSRDSEYPAANYDLHILEEPETIDALELSHWPVLRIGLREWTRTIGNAENCIGVGQSSCLSLRPMDFSQRKPAAIELMETLLRIGWTVGQPPREHTLHAEKVFRVKDAIKERLYLTCLVRLSEVLAANGGVVLLSGQSPDVYAAYLSALTGDSKAVEDEQCDPADMAAIEDIGDDMEFDDLYAKHDDQSSVQKRKRTPTQGAREAKKLKLSDNIMSTLCVVPLMEAPRPIVDDAGAAASSHEPAVAIAVAVPAGNPTLAAHEDVSEQKDIVANIARNINAAPAVPVGTVAVERPLPLVLEGATIYHELRVGENPYHRIRVECPIPGHKAKKACCRRRNLHGDQCKNFGPMEPYAYLGAWLRKGNQYAARSGHMDTKSLPSKSEIEAYMRDQEWL